MITIRQVATTCGPCGVWIEGVVKDRGKVKVPPSEVAGA